jgi:hypothetical protein
MKMLLAILISVVAGPAFGQVVCTIFGPSGYSGPIIPANYVACGTVAPPACTPPAVLDPATNRCVTPQTNPNVCSASQLSDSIGGKALARSCFGSVSFKNPGSAWAAKADVSFYGNTDLPSLLSGGSSRAFMGMLSGAPFMMTVNAGTYVSFPITPIAAGLIQFSTNASFGAGGYISLSTRPGQFVDGNPSVICSNATGGGLYASAAAGAQCPLLVGRTYYVNFAGVDYGGNQVCAGNINSDCPAVLLSYVEYTKKF